MQTQSIFINFDFLEKCVEEKTARDLIDSLAANRANKYECNKNNMTSQEWKAHLARALKIKLDIK